MIVRRCGRLCASRRGMAFVLAVLLLTLLTSLAVALFWFAGSGLAQSQNFRQIQAASLQAESGLEFVSYTLRKAPIPVAASGQEALNALAAYLSEQLDGSWTLQGQCTTYDQTTITIPDITIGNADAGFGAQITLAAPEVVHVRVTGRSGNVQRRLGMNFNLVGGHPVFGFGISSKGPIALEGNIKVLGANNADEARLFSTSSGTAFRLEGGLEVEGEVYASDANAEVSINGTGTIAGVNMADPNVWDHVHLGKGTADFPEIDTDALEPFATSIVDGSTVTSGTKTFNNIRIKANTNPTFSGSITINGVIFIEKPNRVTFGSGTIITGVIASEEGHQPDRDNVIRFENNTYSFGTDQLPDEEMFRELRAMTGSFILAPGFRVHFENEAGAINGIVAADRVKFENTFNGTLRGGIICYGTDEFMAENYSSFTIDHSKYIDVPAGFVLEERKLEPDSETYVEY